MTQRIRFLFRVAALVGIVSGLTLKVSGEDSDTPRNMIVILSDDHRYDFMGFRDTPSFLETPNLDKLAANGAHIENAFVSTSLCSPSRASILTGQYAHRHGVVDNQRRVPEGTLFFPELLQDAGYQTAFIGKWHMGRASAEPRRGFDHWVSFRGQGSYFDPTLNINGDQRQFRGYTTDILTDQARDWLQNHAEEPFFLYLSYKAVHYPFQPAKRHDDRYADEEVDFPETTANTEENYASQPQWVKERRYSIHGIDHMLTDPFDKDPVPSLKELYHQYCETLHGLDENIGRFLDSLRETGHDENSALLYLGDNGFALGEHGFYDKRDAFEESIRIPMLAYAPGLIEPGSSITQLIQNIDIAPTLLDLAGESFPSDVTIDGRSFLPLLKGKKIPWRERILYEYYWEWNFPATPTVFALRGERFKYIFYHGIWDQNGLYDLKTDPHERHNLIRVPAFQEKAAEMQDDLFDRLERTDGMTIPLRRPRGTQFYDRKLKD